MDETGLNKSRLSDRIAYALSLALEQGDAIVGDALAKALELSVTRNSGGAGFVERRDYPPEIEALLDRLDALKSQGV